MYVLDENALTISGGEQLDGVMQGDGSHLDGLTITLKSIAWHAVTINDDDADFQDIDGGQTLASPQTIDGVNTWQVVAFNVNNSPNGYGTVEGLAFIGGPGGFPPVGVPLTVVSTQERPVYAIADYATPVCFGKGALIATPQGQPVIEDIAVGHLVLTEAHSALPVRWHGQRRFQAESDCAPIIFEKEAIGNDRRLVLSPLHRVQIVGKASTAMVR